MTAHHGLGTFVAALDQQGLWYTFACTPFLPIPCCPELLSIPAMITQGNSVEIGPFQFEISGLGENDSYLLLHERVFHSQN